MHLDTGAVPPTRGPPAPPHAPLPLRRGIRRAPLWAGLGAVSLTLTPQQADPRTRLLLRSRPACSLPPAAPMARPRPPGFPASLLAFTGRAAPALGSARVRSPLAPAQKVPGELLLSVHLTTGPLLPVARSLLPSTALSPSTHPARGAQPCTAAGGRQVPRRAQAAHPVLAAFLVPNPLPRPKTWQLVWFIFALTTFVILGQAGLPAKQHTPLLGSLSVQDRHTSRARPGAGPELAVNVPSAPAAPPWGLTTNLTQPPRAPLADPEPTSLTPSPGQR